MIFNLSEEYKHCSGVYRIRNIATEMIYIGSAASLYDRYHSHKSKLNAGKHENQHLQRAYQKYGMDSFVFE